MTPKYAPVLIATLNRYEHFKRCIESLKACNEASKTDLYVALDYPPSEKYRDGYEKIKYYIENNLKGFKKINLIVRTENFGARMNFMDAREFIFEKYDRIIVTEDDNEFSSDFLNFVNMGLNVYEDRSDIFAICGYIYPMKLKKNTRDTFLYQGFSAWGYGTWRNKFKKVNFEANELRLCFNDKKLYEKITSKLVSKSLLHTLDTGYITNDTFICFHQYMNEMKSIFPKVSRVRNHGHDGTGIHCGYSHDSLIYTEQLLYNGTSTYTLDKYIDFDVFLNKKINNYLDYRSIRFYLLNPFLGLKRLVKLIIRDY